MRNLLESFRINFQRVWLGNHRSLGRWVHPPRWLMRSWTTNSEVPHVCHWVARKLELHAHHGHLHWHWHNCDTGRWCCAVKSGWNDAGKKGWKILAFWWLAFLGQSRELGLSCDKNTGKQSGHLAAIPAPKKSLQEICWFGRISKIIKLHLAT